MRPRSALATLVLIPVAAVAVSACGSSSSSSATTAATTTTPTTSTSSAQTTTSASAGSGVNFDSCTVVTQAEAAAALGQTVSAGVLGNATVEAGKACVFYGPSAPTPHTPSVAQTDSVRVVVVTGADASAYYDQYKASSGARAAAISGLGDEAYWDGDASVNVLKGDSYLRVAVAPADAAPSESAAQTLAAAIVPRLP